MNNPNSKKWILRTARIADRNKRSLYSYLFGNRQYTKFFEYAAENLFQVILDDSVDPNADADAPVEDTVAGAEPMAEIDFDAEVFDPFNVGI